MSWSFSFIGKPKAVAAKIVEVMAKNPCAEPEETIRQGVGSIVATALGAFPETAAVRVDASGSQSVTNGGTGAVDTINQLNFKIEPIWVFVE